MSVYAFASFNAVLIEPTVSLSPLIIAIASALAFSAAFARVTSAAKLSVKTCSAPLARLVSADTCASVYAFASAKFVWSFNVKVSKAFSTVTSVLYLILFA